MVKYSAFNKDVFDIVPATSMKILDVGCGTGALGEALKKQNPQRIVHGITYSTLESTIAQDILDKVYVIDLNTAIIDLDTTFDCIIFSHILEHTHQPELIIRQFLAYLTKTGSIVIALPNVLQYKQRFDFMIGNFKYSEYGGPLDYTHTKFFDWITAQELIHDSGLKIIYKKGYGNFPLPIFRKLFPSISLSIDRFFLVHYPGLFAIQFLFIAKK